MLITMSKRNSQGVLFRTACYIMKHFLLFLVGLSMVTVIAGTFGILHLMVTIIFLIGPWLVRVGVAIFCLFAFGVILESIQ